MPTEATIRAAAIARGRALQRSNALMALLCGLLPAALLGFWFPSSPGRWIAAFLAGLVWANAFEYVYHRFLLHLPGSAFAEGHLLHHATVGSPTEGEQVNFAGSPLRVALLFFANEAPLVALDLWLRLGIASGMLVAFTLYFIATEEIHWRIHLGGWLPAVLARARAYHLAHHDRPDARFSVFLPLFDWLFAPSPVR